MCNFSKVRLSPPSASLLLVPKLQLGDAFALEAPASNLRGVGKQPLDSLTSSRGAFEQDDKVEAGASRQVCSQAGAWEQESCTSRIKTFSWPTLLFTCMCLFFAAGISHADMQPNRFFLMGDGKLHLKNMHSGREIRVSLLNPDGSLDHDELARIDELFGFPTEEKGEHICPRMLFILDHFTDLAAPGKRIDVVSAYRDPDYNAALRERGGNVAMTSLHMDGMALDFKIEGVNGKELWELIRSEDCCGVGHYGGPAIHLDSGRPRFWEAGTSGTRTDQSEQNRRIHLSSDLDRYRPGDPVRLRFASVSDFGFGISATVLFVSNAQQDHTAAWAPVIQQGAENCIPIADRKASRHISLEIPEHLQPGKYRMRVVFCQKPFEEMPDETLSNVIEIFE